VWLVGVIHVGIIPLVELWCFSGACSLLWLRSWGLWALVGFVVCGGGGMGSKGVLYGRYRSRCGIIYGVICG